MDKNTTCNILFNSVSFFVSSSGPYVHFFNTFSKLGDVVLTENLKKCHGHDFGAVKSTGL